MSETKGKQVIYLLNALPLSMLEKPEATIYVKEVSVDEAKQLAQSKELRSYIGHEGTAQLLSLLLQQPVPVNRSQLKLSSGELLVIVLTSRLPEGKVLQTVNDIVGIGYKLFYVKVS